MPVNIDCPKENDLATVVVTGSGTAGFIAAQGTAVPPGGTGTFDSVWALVYEGFKDLNSTDVPDTPPNGTPSVGPMGVSDLWYFPKVPGARCQQGGSGGFLCTLVVWAKYPGVYQFEKGGFRHFYGVCGSQVSCPPPAGGAFGAAVSGAAAGTAAGLGRQALSLAPAVWALVAAGFTAGKHLLFNGTWALRLRGSRDGHCFWENDGDGVTSPLVQLRCESPLAAVWHLTFRHGADCVLHYRRPAAEWDMFAANALALLAEDNGAAAAAPATLTVTPG